MLLSKILLQPRILRLQRGVRTIASVSEGANGLLYKGTTYPFRWLRDSCQCPECVHSSNRQKLHRTTDIPADIRPAIDGVQATDAGVQVTWTSGHRSSFTDSFLQTYGSLDTLHEFHHDVQPVVWDKNQLVESAEHLFVPYEDLRRPSGLLSAITQLTQYGLLFVTGVPTQETSNDTCETRKLAQRFGEIRNTFYGELWDVINVRNSTNIAYTNLNLGLHMDLMYFHHPPRFQLLHCLRNRVVGGESVFSDALDAAERLRASNPSDFKILATTPVPFHYINNGHHLHNSHPTIVLDECHKGDILTAPIKYLTYAPPFQAPFPSSTPPEFYAALERFVSYIEAPTAKFEYLLREGDAVFFDNRRVLHARTAFSDPGEGEVPRVAEGEPSRWLKGTYLDADTVLSRGRVLREKGE
ncbi:hypothetical protein NM688_g2814 [Phlebia brevispora]|uniref:Uncharacterized protein n=1 Tax=Phlebia brevispora TaxID=194682 RepID=A0ACC1T7R1_9APHY|nr:hypothetical protein NM688_g2814 [Phlebia brevispora]